MADEPDNLTLRLLREMREHVGVIEQRQEEQFTIIMNRLDTLGEGFDEVRTASIYGLGLSQTANLKIADQAARIAQREREAEEFRQRFDELEALLRKD